MVRSLFLLSVLFVNFSQVAFADNLLDRVELKYSSVDSVVMKVRKTLTLGILKKEKVSEGELKIKKKGRLRLEISQPSKNLVLVDGKSVYVVEYPEGDDPLSKIRVLVSTKPQKSESQALVAFLMGKGRITKEFKIERTQTDGDQTQFTLKPKKAAGGLKQVTLAVHAPTQEIRELTLIDSLDNKTRFVFSEVKFGVAVADSLFSFKIPKNAEVTRLD